MGRAFSAVTRFGEISAASTLLAPCRATVVQPALGREVRGAPVARHEKPNADEQGGLIGKHHRAMIEF